MNIISKLKSAFRTASFRSGGYTKRYSFDSMGGGFWGGNPPPQNPNSWLSGISVNRAMHFTAVYAAIKLRSNTIASLPKLVYDIQPDKGRNLATRHAVYQLLHYRPNRYMNPFSFWNFVNTCVDGWGNSYVIIVRRNGEPEGRSRGTVPGSRP